MTKYIFVTGGVVSGLGKSSVNMPSIRKCILQANTVMKVNQVKISVADLIFKECLMILQAVRIV
ncbi:MAG: hypothetical protein E7523_07995 [Ruminococcaceae bacterium]|nr:hypothetical protein [Oscillospiraceae bacterium]